MEKKRDVDSVLEEVEHGVNRSDFLKSLGFGLGAAGLASFLGTEAMAGGETKGRYIIVVTSGGNNPNRAILALLLAKVAADKEMGSVHVWMTLEGADLASQSKAARIDSPVFKKFGNALEIMNSIKEKGGWFGVCPPCADFFAESDRLPFVKMAAGDWLLENIRDAWVVWM